MKDFASPFHNDQELIVNYPTCGERVPDLAAMSIVLKRKDLNELPQSPGSTIQATKRAHDDSEDAPSVAPCPILLFTPHHTWRKERKSALG
jgi:hypothetical protein